MNQRHSESPSALHDITIVDLSRVLAGPYATMLLGDFGARVIKVEAPHHGDETRRWGPPFAQNGESAYFVCTNRNKESITIDLSKARGQELLCSLVRQADVLVENFRVGTMRKWGLDYDSLCEVNQGLIYCSISGYGQTGPLASLPGYDNIIEAQGGIMSITGPAGEDSEPYKVGVAIADITTGLYAAMSILAALHHRAATQTGQYIDLALFDTQLSWLANVAVAYLLSGEPPQRYGNGHPSIVPYQTFHASDRPIMVAAANDGQFARLAVACGHPEWHDDERFHTNAARVANRDTLIPLLADRFATRTASDWTTVLQDAGIPCSPVNDIPTALSDVQAQYRQMVQTVNHHQTGTIPQLGPVPKMSLTPPTINLPPPLLGEHTEQILRGWLGLSAVEVESLIRDGIV